jgi:hypothetical protein
MYAWASYTRKSFGMLANYLLLVSIDIVGLKSVKDMQMGITY